MNRHYPEIALISFLDPRGEVGTLMEPYTLAHKFAAQGEGTTIALLANGFPDSENFLKKLGDALRRHLPQLTLRFWNKGNPTITAPDTMLKEIQEQCQVAIAAYGH